MEQRRRTPPAQPPKIVKTFAIIGDRKISVSLENEFLDALKEIAAVHGMSMAALVRVINRERLGSLSAAIRVYVLGHYMRRAEECAAPQQSFTSR
jgi:predicted DNA-binding ribbon-helix-helix protein